MRVLLDECVPKRLRSVLADHSVNTVGEMGWSGVKNGKLLELAATQFECFLTVDSNLQFQQHLNNLPLAVLVVRSHDNRFESLKALAPEIREALASLQPKQLAVVGA